MEITGKVHCFFEQSGTFKNEFIKLGIPAEDYDIQNNFGETDHVVDLFGEIEAAYDGKPSIFDNIKGEDLIVAFFPCIYFCDVNEPLFSLDDLNYRKLSLREKYEKILTRAESREYFFELCIKFFCVCDTKQLRMIMENPYSQSHYLVKNFVYKSKLIDKNRRRRGDYFVKPTQYWFVNCNPTHGTSYTMPKETKSVCGIKGSKQAGLCGEERSLISPDYARNFICDFILGKVQTFTQPNTILMNARQFYDLVVELRKAQKRAATTLKYEEIERAFQLERVVDNEIERVTKILQQRNDEQH